MATIPGKNGNGCAGVRLRRPLFVWLALLCMVAQANLGCTRTYYRDYADSDVYGILKERLIDWRWRVPERPVEADPRSRMADLNDPNHVPIVPDEVAAQISGLVAVSVRVSWLEEAGYHPDRGSELAALYSDRIRR